MSILVVSVSTLYNLSHDVFLFQHCTVLRSGENLM